MQTLTREELKAMIDHGDDVLLVNVLDPAAFAQAHIPDSHNVPVADKGFDERIRALGANEDSRIVLYCSNFDCNASHAAAKRLEQAGFNDLYRYAGGIEDWMDAGYPVEGEAIATNDEAAGA
ncbi:rhodanese-like domain-containing protein [Halochromatium roseum]|uniref:rhodanese-like domain-containing protein n=1 Tax=Halochromatium roseum TaxID=391920 RepID=UPI00191485DC|nr:rhodanese-like domain-containing protein [Halochromatium roseum]